MASVRFNMDYPPTLIAGPADRGTALRLAQLESLA